MQVIFIFVSIFQEVRPTAERVLKQAVEKKVQKLLSQHQIKQCQARVLKKMDFAPDEYASFMSINN